MSTNDIVIPSTATKTTGEPDTNQAPTVTTADTPAPSDEGSCL